MPGRVEVFLGAKRIIRLHPDRADDIIAEELGVKTVDTALMATIAEARRDVQAGGTFRPGSRV